MNLDMIDHGRITVASEFHALLQANGLDNFEKVMGLTGGKVVRSFPGRRTVRLELRAPDGSDRGVYLKRYETNYLSPGQRLLRLLRWPGAGDEARREWDMIQAVGRTGLRTATPMAVGQQRLGGAVTRSFVMTAEIAGAVDGSAWVGRLTATERRRLLVRVAEMTRRFHDAGFVHKDYYLGHVLVSPSAGDPELHLIDLQRVTKPRFFLGRWVTKDLGALAYSTFNAGATSTELMRGYLAYCGKTKLDALEKCAVRKTLRRVAWLRTRRPKHDGVIWQRE